MNFQRRGRKEEPEINLVPMIDVLLVILIFLMITTTYSRFSELEITLPRTETGRTTEHPHAIDISVSATGKYTVNRKPVEYAGTQRLTEELRTAAAGQPDPVIVINADGRANHQSIITVMEAARSAGYNRITFTTQTSTRKD